MERMIRELKELNERMIKTMSEHFAQLVMSNRKRGFFPNQPEVNTIQASWSSFDLNDVRKVNVIISLRLGKKVDIDVGKQNGKDSPSQSSSLPSPRSGDVLPSPMGSTPSKEVDKWSVC